MMYDIQECLRNLVALTITTRQLDVGIIRILRVGSVREGRV